MLTKDQRTLLDNALESLNRLYDHDSTATDVHALLVATTIALRESELAGPFDEAVRRLGKILASDATPDQRGDLAFYATDNLRHFIGEQLHTDKNENPKQRHVLPSGGVRRNGVE